MRVNQPFDFDNFNSALGIGNAFGVYPIGYHNTWHGGIHVERECEIKALADGRIIAYRFNETYIKEEIDKEKIPYSNGFILMQHVYKDKNFSFTFYSLYHHLMSKNVMEAKNKVPNLYNRKSYKVKANDQIKGLKAHGSKKYYDTVVIVIPKGHEVKIDTNLSEEEKTKTHWTKVQKGKYYTKVIYQDPISCKIYKDIYVYTKEVDFTGNVGVVKTESNTDDKSEKGARVYDTTERNTFLNLIKNGDEVAIEPQSLKNEWYKLQHKKGYIRQRDIEEKTHFKEDLRLKEVVNCDLPVKAGTIIGHSGSYGVSRQKNHIASHIEVFSTEDPNNFLEGSYKKEKKDTHIKISAGTKLQPNITENITIIKDTPIKVLEINNDFCQIEIIKPEAEVLYAHLVDNYNNTTSHYNIKKDHYETIKAPFGSYLKTGSKLYSVNYKDYKGTDKRKAQFRPNHAGNKFWVKNSDAIKKILLKEVETTANATNEVQTTKTTKTTKTVPTLVTPNKGDQLNLKETISEYFLVKPEKVKNETITLDKDEIIAIRRLKKVKYDDEKHWYFVDNEDVLNAKKGWIKDTDTNISKLSAYNWKDFGFETLDAGDQYVYSVQELLEATDTAAFIKKIWGIVDANKDRQISAQEWQNAYKRIEVVKKFSKLVCKHQSEWSYGGETICQEAEQFFNIGIKLEKNQTKRKELEAKKQVLMNSTERKAYETNNSINLEKDLKALK